MSNDTLVVKLANLPFTALNRDVLMRGLTRLSFATFSGRDLNDNADIRVVRVSRSCAE